MLAQQEMASSAARACWANTLRPIYVAVALLCTASSLLAVAQLFGWHPLPQWVADQTPGLFFNPVVSGSIAALAILALWCNDLPWLTIGVFPGMILSHSRGAWAALVLGFMAFMVRKPLVLLVTVLALAFLLTLHPSVSDMQRLQIWRAAWINLTLWGNGFGSFMYVLMGNAEHIVKPEYAHNEYLQLVFEFGVWALAPLVLVAWALSRSSTRDWPTLVAFSFLACFTMPWHMPVAALIGGLALTTTLLGVKS